MVLKSLIFVVKWAFWVFNVVFLGYVGKWELVSLAMVSVGVLYVLLVCVICTWVVPPFLSGAS